MNITTHIRNCSLTRVVPDQARSWPHSSNTCDVDDGPTTALLQCRDCNIDAMIYRLDIHVHDSIELIFGYIKRRLVSIGCSSVVDLEGVISVLLLCPVGSTHKNIQSSKFLNCSINQFLPVCQRGDICDDRNDMCFFLLCKLLVELLFRHISSDDLGTFGDKSEGGS